MRRRSALALATAAAAMLGYLGLAAPAQAATATGSASGGPGANAYWNDPHGAQGFATALSGSSKVWYTLGNGELENVYYPETDEPDTYGLQYYVTDGSTFTDSEVANTTHQVSLADPYSLTFTQANTATSGKYTITKTYVADPAQNTVLIQTTFDNTSSTPLYLYVDYQPYLGNDGMNNSGGTDPSTGDLESVNGSVASALAASVPFSQTNTGYTGTSSSGVSELMSSHQLTTTYSSTSSSGHIDQTAQIPVAASGSTTFTVALGFGGTESAALSAAQASLASGFSAVESSYESGWHNWLAGLNAPPASVTGSASLEQQYYVSLMELKADEDKTYTGAFIAAPVIPWGGAVSADSAGQHGYHLVWTRDEYEIATALLAAGDTTDANAALTYLFNYEEESTGQVKQNTWLNGNVVWGGNQEDEEADPIILAYQLGRTDSTDFGYIKLLAQWIVSHGPYTQEERWEENSGYSPSTIAAEIAGLVCASKIAADNGDSSDASSWLSTAENWAANVDNWTYTTTGPYGNGSYFLRITPDASPNSGASITIANGGGTHDDRTVVDQGFLELVRLGIKAASATDITNSLAVTDAELGVNTPEGLIDHRYNFDGYGETSTGADYTGAGVGNPWPVLTGERGEYDVAAGNLSGAQAALETMAGAAANDQISEQVWGGSNGVNGFTFGKPDNSADPLMWAMAQFVRLAINISAGKNTDTPQAVCQTFGTCNGGGGSGVTETVNVTVPANTAASGETVYLAGNLSALGNGQSDWAANGIPMTQVNATHWTATIHAASATSLSYKYDLGGTWNNVEETASCGYVSNRSMEVNGGTVNDTVANWAGPNACGAAAATVTVTVPSGTPAGDTVYLSGTYSDLGTGIPASDNWVSSDYPMTQTGPGTWTITLTGAPGSAFQYKYTLGSWSNVEETSSCGFVSNRSFTLGAAGSDSTISDTVAAWQGVSPC
jgi:glucoamylase